jgi:2-polyprenyl-6-methoxyphenol hydroxylase-like FAD-dependent oxidoreductase
MIQHQVLIAGGGPTGMMLGAELQLAGIDVAIIERRLSADLDGSRAGGLNARSLEVLDQRGVVDRFLAAGQTAQVYGFGGVHFDISDFPTRHPYGLALWQKHIERILAGWIDELGVRIYPGIEFAGWEPTISHLIAEVELAQTPPSWGVHHDATGMHGLSRVDYEIRDGKVVYADTGPVRVMLTERGVYHPNEPTLEDLRSGLVDVFGTDYGVHSPTWVSRFTDAARQAVAYRRGRVLLAGDAAHIHYPAGGRGLNTGLQDAVNLGWKLAQVVRGSSPETLLDTYHAERYPVAAEVLQDTLAHVAAVRQDERSKALGKVTADLLKMEEPRRTMGGRMSGLDIHYDLGSGHPLLGRRMPDIDLITAGGPTSMFALLHNARPVLLNLEAPGSLDTAGWSDRVQLVEAAYDGPWELPVVGRVTVPSAVLVRPDGYVAWVGEGRSTGLDTALATWFGPPLA